MKISDIPIGTLPSEESQIADLLRGMRRYSAAYRLRQIVLVEPCASRGRGKKRERTSEEQTVFNAAADHALGVLSAFPEYADKACRDGNPDFFTITAEAILAVNAIRKNETKITRHVRLALSVFLNIERCLKRFPTRWEIREWIEEDDTDCFSEESDWNHVWKQAELDYLEAGQRGTLDIKRLRNACNSKP